MHNKYKNVSLLEGQAKHLNGGFLKKKIRLLVIKEVSDMKYLLVSYLSEI